MINKLTGHIPESVLNELMTFNLTPLQTAHFLAQCHHESGGFKQTVENLNYSASGLIKIFPKYFSSTNVREYDRRPEKISNRVYANRLGNGDEASGDGWKYRGRGYIQLTFSDNQKAFFKYIGLPEDSYPALISNKYPLESAHWFFMKNRIFEKANHATEQCVKEVTRLVNGGTNGIDDRIKLFKKYWNLLKTD